jgi:hypothetical protein
MSIAPVGHNMCARSGFSWYPSRRLSASGELFFGDLSTIAGARTVADEVNKLGRFDAEIHMRKSVSALAELMVRIHSPPAESRANFTAIPVGTARSQAVREARPEQADRLTTGGARGSKPGNAAMDNCWHGRTVRHAHSAR